MAVAGKIPVFRPTLEEMQDFSEYIRFGTCVLSCCDFEVSTWCSFG